MSLRQQSERPAKYIDGHWYLPVEDYHELREALGMAVYHAENLRRYIDREVVRGLAESEVGFKQAKALLGEILR